MTNDYTAKINTAECIVGCTIKYVLHFTNCTFKLLTSSIISAAIITDYKKIVPLENCLAILTLAELK